MLDVESKYVGRELEDHLIQSTNELRETLAKWKGLIATAEGEMQAILIPLPDRQRLALRCMLSRDFWHIAMLYMNYIRSAALPGFEEVATGASSITLEEVGHDDEPLPILPFKETLFG